MHEGTRRRFPGRSSKETQIGMIPNRLLPPSSFVHAARPFLASAYRIRRFVREHALADRPHTSNPHWYLFLFNGGGFSTRIGSYMFIISIPSRTLDLFSFSLSLRIYLWLAKISQQPVSQTTLLKVTPVVTIVLAANFPLSNPLRAIIGSYNQQLYRPAS